MDKTLHILQKSADVGVPTGISLNVDLNMDDGEEEFPEEEQQIEGLPDKIPLVKPYFKKKPRKLDTKCLHRTLEEPILSTLLGTADSLVSGEGVFVLRNQLDRHRAPENLCTVKQDCMGQTGAAAATGCDPTARAGVAGLMGRRDSDVELADAAVELEEAERPEVGDPVADSRCFQPQAGLRAAGSAATLTPPSRELLPAVAPQTPHQQGAAGIKAADLSLTSVAGAGANTLAPQADRQALFQDKSEEASLDLVFELLTQLQYHTHQADSVDICVDFLQGRCAYGSDCARHHTVLPYHWQIRRSASHSWQSVADESQEQLERLYCNPDNEQVRLKFQ